MKLYSACLFKWIDGGNPILVAASYELSNLSFWQKGSAKEVFLFISREVTKRSKIGERNSILHKEHLCHCYVQSDGLACAIVTDEEYPQRVAFSLLLKCMEIVKSTSNLNWQTLTADRNATVPNLDEILLKYQDPSKADDVERILKELDDTKGVLIKSIDQMLERGEKLDNLMAKSEDLSMQTRTFVKQTDQGNCCTIL